MHYTFLWAQIHNWAWQYADVSLGPEGPTQPNATKVGGEIIIGSLASPTNGIWAGKNKKSNKKEFSGSSMDNVCCVCGTFMSV